MYLSTVHQRLQGGNLGGLRCFIDQHQLKGAGQPPQNVPGTAGQGGEHHFSLTGGEGPPEGQQPAPEGHSQNQDQDQSNGQWRKNSSNNQQQSATISNNYLHHQQQ
jgi:hypothetical protein